MCGSFCSQSPPNWGHHGLYFYILIFVLYNLIINKIIYNKYIIVIVRLLFGIYVAVSSPKVPQIASLAIHGNATQIGKLYNLYPSGKFPFLHFSFLQDEKTVQTVPPPSSHFALKWELRCIFAKCTRLACLLSFASLLASQDAVEAILVTYKVTD